MPMPSPPMTYRCSLCHWSKTISPRSDALLPGEVPVEVCPNCSHSPIDATKANAASAWLSRAISKIAG